MALLLALTDGAPCDVKVSWCEFDSQATPCDVKVSWVEFDTEATPCDVRVSWCEFNSDYQQAVTAVGGKRTKPKRRWLERDGKILIFASDEEAQKFIASEIPVIQEKKQKKVIPKPIEVINKQEIIRLSNVYQYRQKLYHASEINDVDLIISLYREMVRLEEEDLELLLMAL
jgi:hypothetical protein